MGFRLGLPLAILLLACTEPEPLSRGPLSPPSKETAPIIGGVRDTGDPAVVALLLEDAAGNVNSLCTGTLISKRVILTAAHCVDEESGAKRWEVYFGTTINEEDPGFIGTRDATVAAYHPSWDTSDLGNGYDIGLIQMKTEAPSSVSPRPINRLPLTSELAGQPIRLVGFGKTGAAEDAGEKRHVTSTLEDFDGRLVYYGSESKNICEGDSGGPNFMTLGGVETVVGVSSFGSYSPGDTSACGSYGAGSRVDEYVAFIDPWVVDHDIVTCGFDGGCATGCGTPDPDCPCSSDGFCTAACLDDPDCPVGCGRNGACVVAGCPVPDPDCTPDSPPPPGPCEMNGACHPECERHDPDCPAAQPGEPCHFGSDCQSRLCIPAPDEDRIMYCSKTCDPSVADCPDTMECQPANGDRYFCAYPLPTPGALGSTCQASEDCVSSICIGVGESFLCSIMCSADAGCAEGYDCVASSESEAVCVPAPSGAGGKSSCRTIPARNEGGSLHALSILVFASLGLYRRRSRARAR